MKRASVGQVLRVSARTGVFVAALAMGCTATHGPESADTATSWLHACVDDGDCTGISRCVEYLCAIPCAEGRSSCDAMASGARCEQPLGASQSVCDLPCDGDKACAALGSAYTCQEGHCRPGSALQLASQTLTLLDPTPEDGRLPGFPPLLTWTGDRFRIAISGGSNEQRHPMSVLEVFELFPDGKFVSQGRPAAGTRVPESANAVSAYPLAINRRGTIAILVNASTLLDSAPASLAEVQFLVPDVSEPRRLECPAAVAPAREGDDWLVLCHDDDGTARLGRYDPLTERWSSPLRLVREGPATGILELSVQGDDAILWQKSETFEQVARIPGAAAGSTRLTEEPVVWRPLEAVLPPPTRIGDTFEGPTGDWLMASEWEERDEPNTRLEPDGNLSTQSAVGFALEADRTPLEVVRFPLSFADATRLHSALRLPERGQVAFCFEDLSRNAGKQQRGQLFVSLFDERGNRVGGPHLLTGTSINNGECRLAWSGSQLLATWLEYEGTDKQPRHAARARVFSVR